MQTGCPKCDATGQICLECQIAFLDHEIAADMRRMEELKRQLEQELKRQFLEPLKELRPELFPQEERKHET